MADSKLLTYLLLGAQITLAAASLVVCGVLFYKCKRGHTLLPCEPRTPVPWSVIDVCLTVLLYFISGLLAKEVAERFLSVPSIGAAWIGQEASHAKDGEAVKNVAGDILGGTLRNLMIVPLVMLGLRLRVKANVRELGLCLDRERYDLRVGLLAFLAVALPVYGIQLVLSRFIEYQHPIIHFLRTANGHWPVLACGLSAVLITPFAEEFLFRVVLQGWLESRMAPHLGTTTVTVALLGESTSAGRQSALDSWLPVIISSALFSLMHLGQGPAPIPIFLFALVLGYLYRQTHRIWPSLLVHACLNAWSMVMVMLEIHVESL